MNTKGFEEFLIDVHAKQYIGLDDDMPDDFDRWLQDLSVDEWLEYGDKFKNENNRKNNFIFKKYKPTLKRRSSSFIPTINKEQTCT